MSQKKVHSLKPIRNDYTYSVYEIADMYKITHDTVFRWIRNNGLKRIGVGKKYFVHSTDLINFVKQRNIKNKKPCQEGEMYCCKCKRPRYPDKTTLKYKKPANKTIRVSGKCSVCNTKMNIIVSDKKWTEKHLFYSDINAPTKPHNGEHETQHKCQTQAGEQLCLNITL